MYSVNTQLVRHVVSTKVNESVSVFTVIFAGICFSLSIILMDWYGSGDNKLIRLQHDLRVGHPFGVVVVVQWTGYEQSKFVFRSGVNYEIKVKGDSLPPALKAEIRKWSGLVHRKEYQK
jgi:hypothetical protein